MVAKEWWEARWKFILAAVVFLAVAVLVPRSFEKIKADIQQDIKWAQEEEVDDYGFYSEGSLEGGPEGPLVQEELSEKERRQFKRENQRHIERLSKPEYAANSAKWNLRSDHQFASFGIMLPLAGLLGVALVSGEVSRGSILLLLSRPMSRDRMLLTKYAVGTVCLLVVALLGGLAMILSAFARGYPPESVDIGWIMGSATLIWLGSLFVLGVALLASVIFKDVLRTLIAAAVAVYVTISIPEILRIPLELFYLTGGEYERNWRLVERWYESFEVFRLTNYWSLGDLYGGFPGAQQTSPWISFAVCIVTAAIPLLAAIWLFRRKTY